MQERTPGVYIVEENAFPNSVVEVTTSIPAFVGYTEQALSADDSSLLNQPVRISSLAEYKRNFGTEPTPAFSLKKHSAATPVTNPVTTTILPAGDIDYALQRESRIYFMYQGIQLFFQNGGGDCYIVSVGAYPQTTTDDTTADNTPDQAALIAGIKTLEKESEPSLLVLPDAVLLPDLATCSAVQNAAIAHCAEMQSRFAILDVYDGYRPRNDPDNPESDCIAEFRDAITPNDLRYAAAYYPWLEATLVQESAISYLNIAGDSRTTLQTILGAELDDEQTATYSALLKTLNEDDTEHQLQTHQTLITFSPFYKSLLKAITGQLNICPPGAAIAGVYARTDNNFGVFKSPANTGINGISRPLVALSNAEQDDLNVPLNGKAVNAIRTFMGRGVLIWGARTLDGNSQDWRYINIRRTLIMLEQSIKLACEAYVFSPNNASTWTTLQTMLENFLNNQWKAGALAGSKPADAYEVDIGLGSTMTGNDILDGYMRVSVKVAVTRPAEFMVITFQQKMQTS